MHGFIYVSNTSSDSFFLKQSLDVKVAVEADEMHLILFDHTEEFTAMTTVSDNRVVMVRTCVCYCRGVLKFTVKCVEKLLNKVKMRYVFVSMYYSSTPPGTQKI